MEKDILKSFSSETGGFSIFNTGNFDQELAKLDQQLSNYYVLGFQSNNPKRDGSLRKIEVKTDLKDVSLRYRKSYMDRLPLDTLASSREESPCSRQWNLLQMQENCRLFSEPSIFMRHPAWHGFWFHPKSAWRRPSSRKGGVSSHAISV